jgi:hypothetical protein
MKKIVNREYIREQLRTNQMAELMRESRGVGEANWVAREQQHVDEITREQRIKSIFFSADELHVVAIQPSSGLFGAFQLVKPEPEIDFKSGGASPADPIQVARQLGGAHLERTHRAVTCASELMAQICEGKIKHYEDLVAIVPSEVSFDVVRSVLAQARKPGMDLETLKGSIRLGGMSDFKKSLPCRKTYAVTADVRAIDDDGKPNGTLCFMVDSGKLLDFTAPAILRSKQRIQAALETSEDAKSLALLHYAKFCQAVVNLELRMDYLIAERRWDIKVVKIVNGAEILATDRTPLQVVRELF